MHACKGGGQAYGKGMYTSMDPTFPVRCGFARQCHMDGIKDPNNPNQSITKTFLLMLQCAVNPDGLLTKDDDYRAAGINKDAYSRSFLIAKDSKDIRAYGILLKESTYDFMNHCNSMPYDQHFPILT